MPSLIITDCDTPYNFVRPLFVPAQKDKAHRLKDFMGYLRCHVRTARQMEAAIEQSKQKGSKKVNERLCHMPTILAFPDQDAAMAIYDDVSNESEVSKYISSHRVILCFVFPPNCNGLPDEASYVTGISPQSWADRLYETSQTPSTSRTMIITITSQAAESCSEPPPTRPIHIPVITSHFPRGIDLYKPNGLNGSIRGTEEGCVPVITRHFLHGLYPLAYNDVTIRSDNANEVPLEVYNPELAMLISQS
ncbi:hypothetical protein ColLi_13296 [Colletotrichum liriopes]|uniref:Uncharacterized protein n=1 Tax=Colletotrichum liriopes TaxID=708192 RepID=A0AA37H2N4_9PEZI|nr:hypothetical protein ColLi_13296 [Colletotrichum liriopes]